MLHEPSVLMSPSTASLHAPPAGPAAAGGLTPAGAHPGLAQPRSENQNHAAAGEAGGQAGSDAAIGPVQPQLHRTGVSGGGNGGGALLVESTSSLPLLQAALLWPDQYVLVPGLLDHLVKVGHVQEGSSVLRGYRMAYHVA